RGTGGAIRRPLAPEAVRGARLRRTARGSRLLGELHPCERAPERAGGEALLPAPGGEGLPLHGRLAPGARERLPTQAERVAGAPERHICERPRPPATWQFVAEASSGRPRDARDQLRRALVELLAPQ